MDALASLLDGPRARGAFLLRMSMAAPWSVRIEDEAPLTCLAVARGGAWLRWDDGTTERLEPGDVAVIRGPHPYVVADEVDRPPTARVLEGERCQTLDGQPLDQTLRQGTRTWGNSPDGPDLLLVGTYLVDGEVSGRLLAAVPRAVVVRAAEWESPLVPVLDAELSRDELGQSAVLDRLLDLLLIATLRRWFARAEDEAPGWYRAQADELAGPALDRIHNQPAEPWTVASLAAAVGCSRATLARRFAELVGEPPMEYLTRWRLSLAADRLRTPGTTLGAVATEVGYASPFGLSAAFKRTFGVSPRDYRRAGAVAAAP